MSELKSKILMIDYDETLAHNFYADSEDHADELLGYYSEHWRGEKFQLRHDGWFVAFKRTWASDLLTFCRELVGNDNVYILTSSTGDYIRWSNIKLELGFDPNTHIFSREDLFRYSGPHPNFTNTHNVLVDDLSYRDHCGGIVSKVQFLNTLPFEQYVKVIPFNVWEEKIGYDSEYFESVKNKIVTALDH